MLNKKIIIFFVALLALIGGKETYFNIKKVNKKDVLLGYKTEENRDYLEFINNYMMKNGGISTQYNLKKKERNKIVLSESQGLIMEIATYIRDKELFDKAFSYLEMNMKLKNNLYSWREDERVKKINFSSATIDDLRVYRALLNANSLWGGYEKNILKIENSLKKLIVNDCLVDFIENGRKGREFSLFYIDGEALNFLSKRDEKFKNVKKKIEKILEKARINKDSPFYKEVYFVNEDNFKFQESADTLNTILITYNRKKMGQNIKKEYEQLKTIFKRDKALYSKYNFQGEPLNRVESTSIYAYFLILSLEEKDYENIDRIRKRISTLIKEEQGLDLPISHSDTVYSFDILILLLASVRR